MDEKLLAAKLWESRVSPSTMRLPDGPGIYAIFTHGTEPVGGIAVNDDGLLYVGKSEGSLHRRDAKTHFKSGKSGTSTLRRSIGAILKQELGLIAIPRGPGNSRRDALHYKFDVGGEDRLTEWMLEHLLVGVAALDGDMRAAEKSAIGAMEPPLNLQGWDNPQSGLIKKLRAACVVEAERIGSPVGESTAPLA